MRGNINYAKMKTHVRPLKILKKLMWFLKLLFDENLITIYISCMHE
jgi:hypothetical protein